MNDRKPVTFDFNTFLVTATVIGIGFEILGSRYLWIVGTGLFLWLVNLILDTVLKP